MYMMVILLLLELNETLSDLKRGHLTPAPNPDAFLNYHPDDILNIFVIPIV